MNLGLLNGGSIKGLEKVGQANRFVKYYLEEYGKYFDNVYYFSYENEYPSLPSDCKCLPAKKKYRKGTYYSFVLPFVYKKYIKKCDLIRVFQVTDCIPAVISKLLFHIPYFTTYGNRHSKFLRIERKYIRSIYTFILEYIGLKFSDGVICTTLDLKKYISRFINVDKIHLVPNGVDIDLFFPKIKNNDSKVHKIIFYGRFEVQKNLFKLLDAIKLLDNVKLIIVGDGSLKRQLAEYIEKQQINCEIMRTIPYEQIPEFINDCTVFVLPSLYEGNPKTLIEAMSCGLPCIGSNVIGINEIIHDGDNGLLCNPHDSKDIAAKINKIINEPALARYLGNNARIFVENNYDLKKNISKEINIMKKHINSIIK